MKACFDDFERTGDDGTGHSSDTRNFQKKIGRKMGYAPPMKCNQGLVVDDDRLDGADRCRDCSCAAGCDKEEGDGDEEEGIATEATDRDVAAAMCSSRRFFFLKRSDGLK